MKKNLLKFTALLMMVMATITVVGYSNAGEPYIVPFKCQPGTSWDDAMRRCESNWNIPYEMSEVVGLIYFTESGEIAGVCRHAPLQTCYVFTSDRRSISMDGAARSLYFDIKGQ